MKYQSLNVLSSKKRTDYMSDDAVERVAMMLNSKNVSESERKRLTRALGKVENIRKHTQDKVDESAYKEYQEHLDEMMVRFFSVLGIVLKNKYNFKSTEDNDEISEMFVILNSHLEEYRELSTEDIAKICYETTGIQLIASK